MSDVAACRSSPAGAAARRRPATGSAVVAAPTLRRCTASTRRPGRSPTSPPASSPGALADGAPLGATASPAALTAALGAHHHRGRDRGERGLPPLRGGARAGHRRARQLSVPGLHPCRPHRGGRAVRRRGRRVVLLGRELAGGRRRHPRRERGAAPSWPSWPASRRRRRLLRQRWLGRQPERAGRGPTPAGPAMRRAVDGHHVDRRWRTRSTRRWPTRSTCSACGRSSSRPAPTA